MNIFWNFIGELCFRADKLFWKLTMWEITSNNVTLHYTSDIFKGEKLLIYPNGTAEYETFKKLLRLPT